MEPADLQSHRDGLQRMALHLLRDHGEAEDVAQQTLLMAVEKRPEERGPVGGWLQTVARNFALQSLRKRKLRRDKRPTLAASAHDLADDPQDALAQAELQQILAAELDAVSDPFRQVVRMRYFLGMEVAAIAEELDIEASTVRTRTKRGIDQLRDRLDDRLGDDWRQSCLAVLDLRIDRQTGLRAGMALAAVLLLATAYMAREHAQLPEYLTAEPAELFRGGLAPSNGGAAELRETLQQLGYTGD